MHQQDQPHPAGPAEDLRKVNTASEISFTSVSSTCSLPDVLRAQFSFRLHMLLHFCIFEPCCLMLAFQTSWILNFTFFFPVKIHLLAIIASIEKLNCNSRKGRMQANRLLANEHVWAADGFIS